jgi:hypothetical protein
LRTNVEEKDVREKERGREKKGEIPGATFEI